MTKEEIEKKQNRSKFILGIVLVGLMLFSTAGYAFFQSSKTDSKKISYGGIKFIFGEDGYWHFSINNNDYATQYNPKEVENISSSIFAGLTAYSGKNLYFSADSNRESIDEINRNIGRFSERVQLACVDECEEDLPVKNCTENIIIIQETNSTSLIKQEDNCIYILSSIQDSVKASDKFIFDLLRIKNA